MRLLRSHETGRVASTLMSCVLFLMAGQGLHADAVFDARGFQPNRELLSELPFEHIDPMTGNVLLTFTDLVLPGNAGFDLRIQRTYNSKIYDMYGQPGQSLEPDSWAGIGWRLHMGRVLNFQDSDPGPIIEMPDGSQHRLYRHMSDVSATRYITKDYWTYEKAFPHPILRLPNGLKYTFGHQGGAVIYATQIEDPFGNKIVINYQPPPAPADVIATIRQELVDDQVQVRTVTFTFTDDINGQEAGSLATMEFNGRIWTYRQSLTNFFTYTQLDEVEPPLGPSWTFEYETANPDTNLMLKHLETPNGGEIDYTYVAQIFHIGSTAFISPALTQRQLSGRDVPAGTWTYAYDSGPQSNETIVTSPCNIKTTSSFLGIGDNNLDPWAIGSLDKRITTDANSVPFETEDLTWIASVPISNSADPPLLQTFVALLGQRDVIRSPGPTLTTTYEYDGSPYSGSRPNNFNDFGRAHTIAENGAARTTSRTFFYGSNSDPSFGIYIVDKTASETVQVGTESFTRNYVWDNTTGFKKSETIYGVTTTFVAHGSGSGNVGQVRDANNRSTFYSYEWAVPDQIQTPEYTITRNINTDSTIASETRRGFTTSFLYDALMRPTKTNPHIGNDIDTTYDNNGAASVMVTRDSSSLTTFIDGFARPNGTQNGLNIKTEVTYDPCGRKSFVSYPFITGPNPPGTSYLYDPLYRVTRRTHPDGKFVRYDYSNGVDLLITDEENHTTFQDWSAFGDPADSRLMDVTDGEGKHTLYTYNALGNLTSASLPGGSAPVRIWSYNPKNQLETEVHPESGQTSYTYDLAGNLKTRSDAGFGLTTFTYDGNNRVIAIDRPGGVYDAGIAYDDSDNRTELTTADVSSVFAYDGANRLLSRSDDLDGATLKTSYQYDDNDNLEFLTYPSGAKLKYEYDSENRITRVAKAFGPQPTYADNFAYHPSGALAQYVAGNGLTHTLTYNNRYQLLNANLGNTLNLTYTYFGNGNVKKIDDTRGSQFTPSFVYDNVDRLKEVTGAYGTPKFTYDDRGNRLSKQIGNAITNYVYDTNSQYLVSATTGGSTETFSYDLNGNQTSDATGTYTYSPTNMLSDASVSGSSTRYLYDGDSQRKARIGAAGISFFAHGPGGQLLGEYQVIGGALQVVREYVMAGTRLIAEVSPTVLTVTPTSLSFVVVLDQGAPAPKTLALASTGGNIPWSATTSQTWLTVSPASGTTPQTVNVGISIANLAAGTYDETITITGTGAANSPVVVPVHVIVFETAQLYVSPSSLSFFQAAGGQAPGAQAVQILFPGNPVNWQAVSNNTWIQVLPPNSGMTPGTVSIAVNGSGLPSGTHNGSVTVTSLGTPGSPQTIAIELVIGAASGVGCAADASYCEIFDDEPLGPLNAGWVWSEPTVPQVVADPRPSGVGRVVKFDPVGGARQNGDVDLESPHAISGTEISVQVMTKETNAAIPWSLAKIEFYTEPGAAWGKTTRTFGAIRFGSTLRFQYGRTDYFMLASQMKSNRWYAITVRYVNAQTEVYLDGVLKFTTPAPDPSLEMEGFSVTSWDFAPGIAYADVLQVRPPGLVVNPMKLSLLSGPGIRSRSDCVGALEPGVDGGKPTQDHSPDGAEQRVSKTAQARMPVAFEANVGQADPSVRFVGRGPGHLLLVRSQDLIMAVPERRAQGEAERTAAHRDVKLSLIRMGLAGARSEGSVRGLDRQTARAHYLLPEAEGLHAARFGRVVSRAVYPGIDLMLRGEHARIEYDLVVAPGADPAQIQWEFEGAKTLRIAESGDLIITASLGQEVRQLRPSAYQELDGVRRVVESRYVLLGQRTVAFALSDYDRAAPVIIAPAIALTTTFHGQGEEPYDVAVDDAGATYVTGAALSPGFPIPNPMPAVLSGNTDAFVTKFAMDGTVAYSSYLGGPGDDAGTGIAVAQQAPVVVGSTSGGFPIANAPSFGAEGADAFVARVSADGSQLLNSTTLGGSARDAASDVALDASGNIYVVGQTYSADFSETSVAARGLTGNHDAYVTGVSADFQQLLLSRYLGGTEADAGEAAAAVAVAADGSVYVAGDTDAADFPGATNCSASRDAFVARVDSSGAVIGSRCLGGSGRESASSLALRADSVLVAGETESADFPLVNPVQAFAGGRSDAFVASLSSDLSQLTFSSPIGGSGQDAATAITTTGNETYVAGWTRSNDFPVLSPAACDRSIHGAAFLVKLNSAMALESSTLLIGGQHRRPIQKTISSRDSGVSQSWIEAHAAVLANHLDQMPPAPAQWSHAAAGTLEGASVMPADGVCSVRTPVTNGQVEDDKPATPARPGTRSDPTKRIGSRLAPMTCRNGAVEEVIQRVVNPGAETGDLTGWTANGQVIVQGNPGGGDGLYVFNVNHFSLRPGTSDFEQEITVEEGESATLSVLGTGILEGTIGFQTYLPTLGLWLQEDGTWSDQAASWASVSGGGTDDFPLFTLAVTVPSGETTVRLGVSGAGLVDNYTWTTAGDLSAAQFTISHRNQPTGPTWQATPDVPWLSLDATSGFGPSTVTVTADPTGLADGVYVGRVTVTATDATGSPQVVKVTLTVSSEPQQ